MRVFTLVVSVATVVMMAIFQGPRGDASSIAGSATGGAPAGCMYTGDCTMGQCVNVDPDCTGQFYGAKTVADGSGLYKNETTYQSYCSGTNCVNVIAYDQTNEGCSGS